MEYDKDIYGNSLEIDWEGTDAGRERYERQEALTQQQIDLKQEEIRNINKINRQRVAESNKAPF